MKRSIIAAAIAAGILITPAVASADVERHQVQTGKITVTLPEYNLVHTFKDVVVNPCDDGSFTGISGTRNVGGVVEEVSGTIKGGKVDFNAV